MLVLCLPLSFASPIAVTSFLGKKYPLSLSLSDEHKKNIQQGECRHVVSNVMLGLHLLLLPESGGRDNRKDQEERNVKNTWETASGNNPETDLSQLQLMRI